MDKGGFTGTGHTQNAHGHTGIDVDADAVQSVPVSGLGIAEGNILKVDRAIGYFCDGVFGIFQRRLFGEQLIGALHRLPAHGEHHKHHGHHHKTHQDLAGVGEHSGQRSGIQITAHHQLCA